MSPWTNAITERIRESAVRVPSSPLRKALRQVGRGRDFQDVRPAGARALAETLEKLSSDLGGDADHHDK